MFTTQIALKKVVQPPSTEEGIERTIPSSKKFASEEEARDMAAAAAYKAICALTLTPVDVAMESGGPSISYEDPADDHEPTDNKNRTRDADVLPNTNENRIRDAGVLLNNNKKCERGADASKEEAPKVDYEGPY